ncbi:MAG TPA: four helix bundle protein [Candidatus Binatia bacterium]|jgi:four helix bundle protein
MQRQPAKTFTQLIVWQKAHQFTLKIYKFTASFPQHETYGLSSQLRRAAVSIAANIAEGFKRLGKQDKRRFLNLSQGSAEECRYYLILATDLGYGNGGTLLNELDEVTKLLESYGAAITASLGRDLL